MKKIFTFLTTTVALGPTVFAALPSVGPDYSRPQVPVASAFHDASTNSEAVTWKTGLPADAADRGEWWRAFGDPVLDELETRGLAANQDLRGAAARVEQARAAAGLARSNYWPQLAANGSFARERTSSTTENALPDTLTSTYRTPLSASWEIDLFGRVRRLSESARADADAAQSTFAAFQLSLTSEIASTYFTLRALERELTVVRSTVDLRRRASGLVSARLKSGTAAEADFARAETELATAEADAAELARRQALMQNALAVLVGVPAGDFGLNVGDLVAKPVAVPAGLPAELLERRPDIAAAERTLASANARIGVAKAAFFPAISLTGAAGYASADIDRLFQADSRVWSIMPTIYLPIFQGGRNRANLDRSRGAFDEAVASYRQRVLVAFREVQDALTASRLIEEQASAQQRALVAARRAVALAQVRYDAGYVAYLEVIDAQRTALAVERGATQLEGLRLTNNVSLIKALGGGWHVPATIAMR